MLMDGPASCAASDPSRHYQVALKDSQQTFRVYVMHPAAEALDLSQIRWPGDTETFPRRIGSEVGAKSVDRLNLGEDVVTLLEAPVSRHSVSLNSLRLWVEGHDCTVKL
jgi:hypothetical protein